MSEQPTNERENSVPQENQTSGEYRFVRPENGEHYTDAQYIPRDQAPNTPRHYSYAPEEPKPREGGAGERKRRRRIGVTAALCIVCILLGAAVGVIGVTQWDNWFVEKGEEAPLPVEITPEPSAVPATPEPSAAPEN